MPSGRPTLRAHAYRLPPAVFNRAFDEELVTATMCR
jgi:hypothetical protein